MSLSEKCRKIKKGLAVINRPTLLNMARPDAETSNEILDTLADWNTYLEKHVPHFKGPQP